MYPDSKNNMQIYQICYSKELLKNIPENFHALDNTENLRPDWREYWPIRNFLIDNELDDNKYYGFLSPKFFEKTGLDYSKIIEFVKADNSKSDIISFSPFWDLSSFFMNSFEQGNFFQPGLLDCSQKFLENVGSKIILKNLIANFNNTIFCNYFVAKKSFWYEWLLLGEKLYFESENSKSNLCGLLNENTLYGNQLLPMKIFIQERLIDLVIYSNQNYKVANYPSMRLPMSTTPINKFINELVVCESLKTSYINSQQQEYINLFFSTRREIAKKIILQNPEFTNFFEVF